MQDHPPKKTNSQNYNKIYITIKSDIYSLNCMIFSTNKNPFYSIYALRKRLPISSWIKNLNLGRENVELISILCNSHSSSAHKNHTIPNSTGRYSLGSTMLLKLLSYPSQEAGHDDHTEYILSIDGNLFNFVKALIAPIQHLYIHFCCNQNFVTKTTCK